MESPKCIGTIGRKCFGASSCVLCREIVLISERPLPEIPLYILTVCIYCMYVHTICTVLLRRISVEYKPQILYMPIRFDVDVHVVSCPEIRISDDN